MAKSPKEQPSKAPQDAAKGAGKPASASANWTQIDTTGMSPEEIAATAEQAIQAKKRPQRNKVSAPNQKLSKNTAKHQQIVKSGSDRVEMYALFDPRVGDTRYIGKASNAAARLKSHLRETRRNTPLYCWIAKLRTEGVVPGMRVIAVALTDNWQDLERALIQQGRDDGLRLLNVTEGRDEPHCPTEVRAENGRKVAAAIASDPLRKRLWEIKRFYANFLRDKLVRVEAKERAKARMRYLAALRPDLFGAWATV